jgi:hypothetical protein
VSESIRVNATYSEYSQILTLTPDRQEGVEPVVTALRALADKFEQRAGSRFPLPQSSVTVEFESDG